MLTNAFKDLKCVILMPNDGDLIGLKQLKKLYHLLGELKITGNRQ